MISKVILQNVKVLAVGKELEVNERNRNQASPATVATLLVNPEESEKLALSATEGRLMLTLRSWTDNQAVITQGIYPSTLIAGDSTKPRDVVVVAPPPRRPAVRVAQAAPPPPAAAAAAAAAASRGTATSSRFSAGIVSRSVSSRRRTNNKDERDPNLPPSSAVDSLARPRRDAGRRRRRALRGARRPTPPSCLRSRSIVRWAPPATSRSRWGRTGCSCSPSRSRASRWPIPRSPT